MSGASKRMCVLRVSLGAIGRWIAREDGGIEIPLTGYYLVGVQEKRETIVHRATVTSLQRCGDRRTVRGKMWTYGAPAHRHPPGNVRPGPERRVEVNAHDRRLVSDERQLVQFCLNRLSDFDFADAQDPVPDREEVGVVPDRHDVRPAHGEPGAGVRLHEIPILDARHA
jgi:hypothetical protein